MKEPMYSYDFRVAEGRNPDSIINTPWGRADHVYDLARGLRWVSTPGHGGLMVSRGLADKKLTPTARKFGELWGGYLWYEEDIAWTVPCYEVPEWMTLVSRETGSRHLSSEELKRDIEKTFPKYFEGLGNDVDAPKLKPGMELKFVKPLNYRSKTFRPGDLVTVSRTSTTYFEFTDSSGITYRTPIKYYVSADPAIEAVQ